MRLRLTKIDEYQFLTCFNYNVWGRKVAKFKEWNKGDYLGIIVGKNLAALAEVVGPSFISSEMIWDDDLYPYRIPIKFTHVLKPQDRPPVFGKVRDLLMDLRGQYYGFAIMNQLLITNPHADKIIKIITSKPNSLIEYRDNLSTFLEEAKLKRENNALK